MLLMILKIFTSLEQTKFDLKFILSDFTANNYVAILRILLTWCLVLIVLLALLSVVTLFLLNTDSVPFCS